MRKFGFLSLAIRRATHLDRLSSSVCRAAAVVSWTNPSHRRASHFEARPLNRSAINTPIVVENDDCCDKVGTRPARSDDRRRRFAPQPALQPAPHLFSRRGYRRRCVFTQGRPVAGLGVRLAAGIADTFAAEQPFYRLWDSGAVMYYLDPEDYGEPEVTEICIGTSWTYLGGLFRKSKVDEDVPSCVEINQ